MDEGRQKEEASRLIVMEPGKYVAAAIFVLAVLAMGVIYSGRYPGVHENAYPVFMQQILYDDRIHSIAMLISLSAGLLLAGVTKVRQAFFRVIAAIGEYPVRACALVFFILVIAARLIYQGFPYSMDEYAPLLQARAFAEGKLTAEYPPALLDLIVYPAYQGVFVLVNPMTGQAMSVYWPGLAILMAPFAFLHLESALNPLLSVVALWLIGDLAVKLGGAGKYRGWAMLAALASPQFTINAVSFYAMPGLLTLNLLFIWLLLRPGARSALAAGLAGSLALVMVNPVPHMLSAVPCMIWLLLSPSRRRRLPLVAMGYLPLVVVLGLGWPWLTSQMGMDRSAGIAPDIAASSGFLQEWILRLQGIFALPDRDLILARWYATWKAWVWMAPGLAILPWVGRWRSALFWLMASILILTYVFYFFVPYDQGYGWGYRYIHPAWGFIPIFSAIAMAHPNSPLRKLGVSILLAGLMATPVFGWVVYERLTDAIAKRIEGPAVGNSIVFIALPKTPPNIELVQNYPGRPNVLYLISRGEDLDAQLVGALWPSATRELSDVRGSLWSVPVEVQGDMGDSHRSSRADGQ